MSSLSNSRDRFYHSGNSSLGNTGMNYESDEDEINSGDIHDYLKSDMGERRYRILKNSKSLRLENIYIRKTDVLGKGKKFKGLVNHDAVVLELTSVQEGMRCLYHILAEKSGTGPDKIGRCNHGTIHIQWMKEFQFNRKLDEKFDCFGSAINFKQVVTVLKTPSPKYGLIQANCWQYAAKVTCDLIKKLVEKASGEMRAKLQSVLNAAQQHLHHTMEVIPGSVAIALLATISLGVFTLGIHLFSGHSACQDDEE